MLQPPRPTGHAAPDTGVLQARHGRDPHALVQVLRELPALRPVCRALQDELPPQYVLLGLRGMRFELGRPPSKMAAQRLDATLTWGIDWSSRQKVQRHA